MDIKRLKLLAKGHRSIVYTGVWKGKRVAVKKRRFDIDVSNHILNEGGILGLVNKYKLGPKLYYYDKDELVMEYIKGARILDWIEKNNKDKAKIRKIVDELLRQCRLLDKIGVEKQEMHRPIKHAIIGNKLTLIDFERARKRRKPRNVTQVCQFLIRLKLMRRDIETLRKYKKNENERNFNALKKLLI